MSKVRLGVIGTGNMGTAHVKSIQNGKISGVDLVAVCDIDPKAMKKIDDVEKFESSEELIRSGRLDAVLIATPHFSHTTIGIDALNNNLHVLVEKPIAVHKKDCEKLIAAHKDKDLIFAAMFNQRTDPYFKKIKHLIDRGDLGEITRINWIVTDWFRTQAYYNSGSWRATWEGEGGGVLLNQCPHQLDLYQWFFGMPDKVRAFCGIGKKHDIEVEDEVTAYMQYKNGATGVFITTTGEAPGTNRLEITGENGKLVFENNKILFTKNEISMTEFNKTTDKGFGTPEIWNVEIPVNGTNGQHVEIIQNFVDAIADGKELIAPAEEGIKSVELGNAMLFSSMNDMTVEMPLDSDAYADILQSLIDNSTFEKKTDNAVKTDFTKSFTN
ncbi:MAG: Gfo/Idh/MocA family oxidoreductase [Verrucomicrobiota bacterium]|nr:Gfo/Idh/MocA family oxidoreductase [Verrucomicrobiota bacterium]